MVASAPVVTVLADMAAQESCSVTCPVLMAMQAVTVEATLLMLCTESPGVSLNTEKITSIITS